MTGTAEIPSASTFADRTSVKVPSMIGGGEMGRRVRDTDWSTTPLGDYATWPQSLRSSLSLVLNAKGIAALYWGSDQWLLYNDAYGQALGERHPWAFGRPMLEALPDLALVLGPQVAKVLHTGEGFAIENLSIVMRRHGRDEETVWTYSFSPVQGESGDFAGVLLLATEMTEQKAAERRWQESQDRLTVLAEASSEAFYSMSPDWSEMRQLTGRGFLADTASANRDWMTDYILSEDRPTVGAEIAEAIRTRSSFHFEHRVRRADGSVGWTASRAVPLLDAAGSVAEWFGAASDITERVNAERSAERVRRRLEAALRVAKLGTYDWRTSNGVVELDARARDIFGLPASGVIRDKDVFGRMAPEDLDRVRAETMEVVGQRDRPETGAFGRSVDIDYDILLPDGSRRSVASSGTLMLDDEGERRVVGSFDDVTDLKRAEARLREQNAFLERRVQERTQDRNIIWQVSRELLVVTDDQGRMLRVNPAWTRVLGWDERHLLGRTSEWLEHPDDRAKTRDVTAKLAEHGGDMTLENRLRAVDGSYRTLAWTAVSLDGQFYCSGRDVTEDAERAETLRRFQMRAALYFDFSQDYLFLVDVDADGSIRFEAMNPACATAMGLSADVVGRSIDDILPANGATDVVRFARLCLKTGQSQNYLATREYRIGHPVVIEGRVTLVERSDVGGLVMFSGTDVTEQRRTEEALRQSQKMEAVGQLTGGLAHDFNNLLTGISGSLDLLQRRVAQGRISDLDRYIIAAQGASKRAAALTHRLLAFSRRQTLDPRPTDVDRLVHDMEDLIRRTVGPAVHLEVVGTVGLWTALVDPNQLENALLNLAINARDAMPDGGRLTIETGNRWMDDRAARERDLPPGQYLSICVSDTGTGMPPDVIARAFDPFFTTKPLGQGTGLGLSMIYGFARQSGGQVRIYSEVGQGTTMCIYLPRHYGEENAAVPDASAEVRGAEIGETVLIIDDEPTIRMLVVDVLSDLGYAAIEAEDGASGLRALKDAARIDLLVTDVGLPGGMNGRQVADAARVLRPDLKVLFITGYAENAAVGNGHLEPGMAVLTKPFAMDDLGAKIRALIEG